MKETETIWTDEIKSNYSLFDLDLKEVWKYKDLVYMFVKRDFVTTFKQTILGPLWFFINPILTTIMFVVVFGQVAKISTDRVPQVLFYLGGVTLWNYFSTTLNSTANVFQTNASIFGKVYFPRLVMPLSIVFSSLMRFFIQYALFLVFMIYFYVKGQVHPNYWVFATPFIVLTMAVMSLGIGMILSSLTTKYKDMTVLLSFAVQLFMYATPVIYPFSSVPDKYKPLIALNPLTGIFESFKYGYFGQGDFTVGMLAYSMGFAVVILMIGTLVFNKVQRSFMDTV